jgi:hypothetical protein
MFGQMTISPTSMYGQVTISPTPMSGQVTILPSPMLGQVTILLSKQPAPQMAPYSGGYWVEWRHAGVDIGWVRHVVVDIG